VELVALLRVLWRYRIAVAVGGILALGLGYYMITKSSTSRVGVASLRVLLDTPTSQTVDANPLGVDTLAWRASLFADLSAAEPTRDRIAQKMGIPRDSLVVTAPYMSAPPEPFPLPRAALDAAATPPQPYQLAIQAVDPLPIIAIDASAPSRGRAAQLVTVAAQELKAAAEVAVTPDTQTFVVEDVGPVRAKDVVTGPSRKVDAIMALLAFGLWCALIMLFAAISRARHGQSQLRVSTATSSRA
jgi:hypothetical protein